MYGMAERPLDSRSDLVGIRAANRAYLFTRLGVMYRPTFGRCVALEQLWTYALELESAVVHTSGSGPMCLPLDLASCFTCTASHPYLSSSPSSYVHSDCLEK
ncbi:hypothetical protein V6N13_107730 [Hibiscus sabdariffa]